MTILAAIEYHKNQIKLLIEQRNKLIVSEFNFGVPQKTLAKNYNLGIRQIKRIINEVNHE